jgi:hypothetical protein
MGKRKRTYDWFVEPLDANTNAALARELPEEDVLRDIRDSQGIKHDIYRVGSRKLSYLRRSAFQSNLKIRVYVREGQGEMRFASFLMSQRPKTGIRSRREVGQ